MFLFTACERGWNNPTDTNEEFGESSEAYLEILGPQRVMAGDTIRVKARMRPKEAENKIYSITWDLDGDGYYEKSSQSHTIMPVVSQSPGSFWIQAELKDRAGYKKTAKVQVSIDPHQVEIPWNGGSDTIYKPVDPDTGKDTCTITGSTVQCGLNSDLEKFKSVLIQTAQAELNQQSLASVQFLDQLYQKLITKPFSLVAPGQLGTSGTNGVYIDSGPDYHTELVFIWAQSGNTYSEGDTLRANPFQSDSYFTGIDWDVVNGTISFAKGPLFDWIQGDIQYRQSDGTMRFSLDPSLVAVQFSRLDHDTVSTGIKLGSDYETFPVIHNIVCRQPALTPESYFQLINSGEYNLNQSGSQFSIPPTTVQIQYFWQNQTHFKPVTLSAKNLWNPFQVIYRKQFNQFQRETQGTSSGWIQLNEQRHEW